ncbi:MAG: hypothetical protein ACE5KU_03975 [Nitrososphaerales archaeon]
MKYPHLTGVDTCIKLKLFRLCGKEEEGVYDMTGILEGSYREELLNSEAVNSSRNNLAKRFKNVVKEYY